MERAAREQLLVLIMTHDGVRVRCLQMRCVGGGWLVQPANLQQCDSLQQGTFSNLTTATPPLPILLQACMWAHCRSSM